MPRLVGVDIPKEKRMEISLTYIYGIGRSLSNKILKVANISPDKRAKDLTEEEVARVAAASPADVESAVGAAHRAFPAWSRTTKEERLEALAAVREAYKRRIPAIAAAMTTEVGIPKGLAEGGQAEVLLVGAIPGSRAMGAAYRANTRPDPESAFEGDGCSV